MLRVPSAAWVKAAKTPAITNEDWKCMMAVDELRLAEV